MTNILFLKQHKSFLISTIALTILNALLTLLTPLLLHALYQRQGVLDQRLLLLIVGCLIVSFVVQLGLIILRENFAQEFNVANSLTYFRQFFKADYSHLVEREPTYLVNRMIDSVVSLYLFFTSSLVALLGNGLVVVLSLLIFWWLNPFLALFISLIFPLNYFGYRLINQKLQVQSARMAERNSNSLKEVINLCQQVDYVKQEGNIAHFEHLLTPPLRDLYQQMAITNKFARSTSLSLELLNNALQTIMFLWLAFATINQASLANLVIASILFPIYFASVKSFTQINLDFTDVKVAETFRQTELVAHEEADGPLVVEQITEIKLADVQVTFPTSVLTYPLRATLVPNDRVYLNGKSGSGKSTLLKALLKFRPSSGLTVNGQPLAALDNASLRQRIAYLGQTSVILNGTLKENILFGRPDPGLNWEELARAPLLAPLFETKEWHTKIVEGGHNLSGGEKQRLALARVLIGDYDVLLLDEVTSNLDEDAAADLMTTLLTLTDKIIIYITHDQTLRRFCTKEIVL